MKKMIKKLIPHGLVLSIQEKQREKKRQHFLERVKESEVQSDNNSFSWKAAVDFLEKQGCPRNEVILGSMPETSLQLIAKVLRTNFHEESIVGIHVGNFVGVSLAFLADVARSIHPDSIIIAVDPNLPHRGIENPQKHVSSLLQHFSLTKNVVILAAYSLEKSQSNDGESYVSDYDPTVHFKSESACENGLGFLERFLPARADFLIIDGNHDDAYLSKELLVADKLISDAGLLILDDVSEGWHGVQKCFQNLNPNYQNIAEDGRIGIAKKKDDR